jgi:hypothetical protein
VSDTASAGGRPKWPRWQLGLLAWIAVLLATTSPYFEAFLSDNERPRLLQAMAIVDAGETAIDGPATRGLPAGADVARARFEGARLHPNKPPGGTVPAVLAYGLVRALGPEAPRMVGFTALARILGGLLPTLIVIVVFWRRFGERLSAPALAGAATIYALATPVASYAKLLYGHQLTACLLFGGVLALTGPPGRRPSLVLSGLGGLLCAAAITVEYQAVFAGLPIAGFLLIRAREPGGLARAGAALAGALVPVLALAGYHQHAFGGLFETPYHHVVVAEFADKHGRGLLGLHLPSAASIHEVLGSAWGGLLPWAPVLLVGIAGALVLARGPTNADSPAANDARQEARLHLAIFAIWLVVVLGLTQSGGWRVGPRYLIAAAPMLLLGLGLALERARTQTRWLIPLAATALAGAFANGLAANVFPSPVPEGSPLRDQLLPLVAEGARPWTLLGPLAIVWPLVILAIVTVFGTLAFAVAEGRELPPRAARGLGLAVGLAVLLGAALTLLPAPAAREAQTFEMLTKIYASTPGPERPAKRIAPLP